MLVLEIALGVFLGGFSLLIVVALIMAAVENN
jgi:hypothetical protein